jgi:hypothetical protein
MFISLFRPRSRRATVFLACLASTGVLTGHVSAADGAVPPGCELAVPGNSAIPAAKAVPPVFPPVQVQVRTPVEPTVLPSEGKNYLIYELHLHNFTTEPITVHGIQVLDADRSGASALAQFKEPQLGASLRKVTIGDDGSNVKRLGVGEGAVAFLCLAFDARGAIPLKLKHRVLFDQTSVESSPIKTNTTPLQVLGRPLVGSHWTAANSPSLYSHHRMGLWVVGGDAAISRRYAIDWKKFDRAGNSYAGDPRDVHAYYAYGQKVLAVADGKVVAARDGFPDNVPKTAAGFEPATPVTLETIGGNQVIIDIGNGQFAAYFHLQPGSVTVKPGDHVRRGQSLARVGNSGDARWPHLHFQVTDKADAMASEGLPQLFDSYRITTANKGSEARTNEYPMGELVLDFGPDVEGK